MTIDPAEVDAFVDQVSEVSRLVAGLKEGTISPDYIDTKIKSREKKAETALASSRKGAPATQPKTEKELEEAEQEKEAERERLMAKVEELKLSRAKKLFARHKFEQYVATKDTAKFGTDYTKWDMWCPEDEDDDMINSICPNQSQFKAMEKDIEERHKRMIECRQLGERARVSGNAAFKTCQYSEALRCYQSGIEGGNKTNMTLHANAAQAALRIKCYVQAVLNIADFLNNNTQCPLCVKAYMRRSQAYRALQQYNRAVQDLESALAIEPENTELQVLFKKAKIDAEEQQKAKKLRSAVAKGMIEAEERQKAKKLRSAVAKGNCACLKELRSWTDAPKVTGLGGKALPAQRPKGTKSKLESKGAKHNGESKVEAATEAVSRTSVACGGLIKLMDGDDTCAVYFRDCGGMQAACTLLTSSQSLASSPKTDADLLSLLNSSLMNDGNLCMMPSLKLPATCVEIIKRHAASSQPRDGASSQPRHGASSKPRDVELSSSPVGVALHVLCTGTTNDEVRKEISKHVGTEQALVAMFKVLDSSADSIKAVALTMLGNCMVDKWSSCRLAVALTMLGNCMVDKCTKGAMLRALDSSPSVSDSLQLLLNPKSSTSLVITEKMLALVGNMCGDTALRRSITARENIIDAVANLACTSVPAASSAAVSLRNGALTTLFNLCLEVPCQAGVQAGGHLPKLVALIDVLPPVSDDSGMGVLQRTAGIISRCAKVPASQKELLDLGAVPKMLALAEHVVGSKATSAAAVGSLDAAMRLIAQLTAQPAFGGGEPGVTALIDANALLPLFTVRTSGLPLTTESVLGNTSLCLGWALMDANALLPLTNVLNSGLPLTTESVLGNTSLCLGHVARYPENYDALAAVDAVAPLVKVAYDGKGNSASKNAAIGLAKMAQDGRMMARLKELHGLEIIYTYVKP
eukprot:gene17965-24370_t